MIYVISVNEIIAANIIHVASLNPLLNYSGRVAPTPN
jgi:hypothetical protein